MKMILFKDSLVNMKLKTATFIKYKYFVTFYYKCLQCVTLDQFNASWCETVNIDESYKIHFL